MLDPWRFQLHIEVWVLVAFLISSYVYVVRVLGPRAVPAGEPVVTRSQLTAFVAGIAILWFSTDWPMHDIAEEYLYSVHMFQDMALTYFMPPLVVLATPQWLPEFSSATVVCIGRFASSGIRYARLCCSTWASWSVTFQGW